MFDWFLQITWLMASIPVSIAFFDSISINAAWAINFNFIKIRKQIEPELRSHSINLLIKRSLPSFIQAEFAHSVIWFHQNCIYLFCFAFQFKPRLHFSFSLCFLGCLFCIHSTKFKLRNSNFYLKVLIYEVFI